MIFEHKTEGDHRPMIRLVTEKRRRQNFADITYTFNIIIFDNGNFIVHGLKRPLQGKGIRDEGQNHNKENQEGRFFKVV